MSHFAVLVAVGEDIDSTDRDAVTARIDDLIAKYSEHRDDVEPYREYQSSEDLGWHLFYQATVPKSNVLDVRWDTTKTPPSPGDFRNKHPKATHGELEDATNEWNRFLTDIAEMYTDQEICDFHNKEYEYEGNDPYSGQDTSSWYADEEGVYCWSAYNQDSKWDWWELGGRWMGFLRLKRSHVFTSTGVSSVEPRGVLGNPGVFDNKPTHDADAARNGDIDWEAMIREKRAEREKLWDDAWATFPDADDVSQRQQRAWSFSVEPDVTREEYINVRECTYAYVDSEGEWFGQGSMGWFGLSDGKLSKSKWEDQFYAFVASQPPTMTMAVIDCHV